MESWRLLIATHPSWSAASHLCISDFSIHSPSPSLSFSPIPIQPSLISSPIHPFPIFSSEAERRQSPHQTTSHIVLLLTCPFLSFHYLYTTAHRYANKPFVLAGELWVNVKVFQVLVPVAWPVCSCLYLNETFEFGKQRRKPSRFDICNNQKARKKTCLTVGSKMSSLPFGPLKKWLTRHQGSSHIRCSAVSTQDTCATT